MPINKKNNLEVSIDITNKDNELRLNLCKNIQSNINSLSQNELYEIFKILYKNNSTYTKNNNGVFVNLNWLDYNILKEINDYIIFCIKSHKEIKKYEIIKNMYNENLNKNKYKNEEIENELNNNLYDNKNEEIINNNKSIKIISSSMKFYLFKKKFSKKNNIVHSYTNLLSHENYIIKN